MSTPENLPHEIIENIIFLLDHPYDHLSFMRNCSTVFRAYTAKTYRLLCINQGFSRSEKDKKVISWDRLFHSVLGHSDTCKEAYCNQFGGAGVNVISSIEKMIKHPKEYFPRYDEDRKLHIHIRELVEQDLKHILVTPFLSIPLSSPFLDKVYHGTESTNYLITFWGEEIRRNKWSLGSHPKLGWAFACLPPIQKLVVQLILSDPDSGITSNPSTPNSYKASLEVENGTGVTVFDIIMGIHSCLKHNLPRRWRDGYPKHLGNTLTWYDHLKLADRTQRSRILLPIEKVCLTKSIENEELVLEIRSKKINY
ncbi:uncharacterized protein IL334_005610 [Kwoniella shivajii]|uniref:F-box domain-containing protein n=1 Tax=Kwoniella shivajii TaxID=564305 RepID=A0ABZ1D3M0_9TREE|nr:hypothetical protein IL334_005610 [Kwoniella shivajii]